MIYRVAVAVVLALTATCVTAKECWALTELQGQIATSVDRYAFQSDKFSAPMLLCFNDQNTGTVTGDDTQFVRVGTSTLVGFARNKGIELVESYQIDRVNGRVLFIKSRIGTATVIPGGPDIVGAFVGRAVKVSD